LYRACDPGLIVSSKTQCITGFEITIPVCSRATASGDHVPASAIVARGQSDACDSFAGDRLLCCNGSAGKLNTTLRGELLTSEVFAAVCVQQVILVFARLAGTQVDELPKGPTVRGP
jgi:hypothetical protein